MKFRGFIVLAMLLGVVFLGCKKKSEPVNDNPVPSVQVRLSVYPNDPLNFAIQAIGGWKYIEGGVNGIIVYRKSEQEFVAVERTSSFHPDRVDAKVFVMSDNFSLRDTVSDSRWRIFDGSIMSGPAKWPLRLYGTTFDGNLLRITN